MLNPTKLQKPKLEHTHYSYKEKVYRVIDVVRTKDFSTREWLWAVLYKSEEDELPLCVRSWLEFNKRFYPIPF